MTCLKFSRRNFAWLFAIWVVLLTVTVAISLPAIPAMISFLVRPRLNMDLAAHAAENERWQTSRKLYYEETAGTNDAQLLLTCRYDRRFMQYGMTYFSILPERLIETTWYQETHYTFRVDSIKVDGGKGTQYYAVALVDGVWLPVRYSDAAQIKDRLSGVLVPSQVNGKLMISGKQQDLTLPEFPYELDVTQTTAYITLSGGVFAAIFLALTVWVSKKVWAQMADKNARPLYKAIASFRLTEEQLDEMLKGARKHKGRYYAQWLVLTPFFTTTLVKPNLHHPKAWEAFS
jgi:hypothetical protein